MFDRIDKGRWWDLRSYPPFSFPSVSVAIWLMMYLCMAITANSEAVGGFISEAGVVLPRFYMVGLYYSTFAVTAFLTNIIISFKNSFPPLFVIRVISKCLVLWGYATFPVWRITANTSLSFDTFLPKFFFMRVRQGSTKAPFVFTISLPQGIFRIFGHNWLSGVFNLRASSTFRIVSIGARSIFREMTYFLPFFAYLAPLKTSGFVMTIEGIRNTKQLCLSFCYTNFPFIIHNFSHYTRKEHLCQ